MYAHWFMKKKPRHEGLRQLAQALPARKCPQAQDLGLLTQHPAPYCGEVWAHLFYVKQQKEDKLTGNMHALLAAFMWLISQASF